VPHPRSGLWGARIVAADLILQNARIYTAEPALPWADALACRDGRIARIGSGRDVERLGGPQTEILDGGGRLVLPGFIDAHVHLISGYELGSWIDLTDRPSLVEVQKRVAQYARAHPEEAILVGHGFDYAALQAEGVPNKADLDAAASDRPVILTAWDGHTGWGNSRFVEEALAVMANVGADVGKMERDPRTREPTGIFHRTFDLTPLLPEIQARRSIAGLAKTVAAASAYGITTAFDVQVNLNDLHAYGDLRAAGRLTVRMRIALYHPKDTKRDRYTAFEAERQRFQDDWLRVAAVKLYIDGVQETGTAALLEPYANDPSSRGTTVYDVDEFRSIVAELDRLGFQVCTHACGDRGVRVALDAYEAASRTNGTEGRRHRIEHCENLSPDDVPRFARLGVIPCMMPRHASPELTTRWREAVGSDRTRIAFPWRALLSSGASLAFASDWPVSSMNPLVGIQEALLRKTAEGEPSPHRVSLADAIDSYTRRAAFACYAESTCGSLAEGKYADFLVLSRDLFRIPAEEVLEAHVVRTVVEGRIVFADDTPIP
jgi:predicted amidohydrolase YtcJ